MLRRLAPWFVAVLIFFHAHAAAQPAIAQVHDAGVIRAIAVQADGKVIIGGSFQHVNGVERSNIARLNADLTLDMTWNPGADEAVFALASDGAHVYAGGNFWRIGGREQPYLAKLSSSGSGAADPSWSMRPSFWVRALALDGAGDLYIGGLFTQVANQNRSRLAKVSLSTALLDPTWNPGADNNVLALAYRAGALYAGGSFAFIGGQSRNRIAKLSASGGGSADATWNAAANSDVVALATDAGGQVYASGYFNSIGGAARNFVAKLSGSGLGTADPTWNPTPDGVVMALLAAPDGSIYAGGSFGNIGGRATPGVARLSSATGAADPAFTGVGMNGAVTVLELATAGRLLAGGEFQKAGTTYGGGFAALSSASGTAVGPSLLFLTPGVVDAVAVDTAGRTVIGGRFIAMGDRTTMRANVARLLADGTLDPGWQPQADGPVKAIAFDAAGNTFIGGEFNRIGAAARQGLAKLDSQGQLVAAWAASWTGSVYALTFDGASNVFIGGQKLDRLATATGAATSNFPLALMGGAISALALESGALYVGGGFSSLGGVARNGLAKVSATNGAVDPNWNPSPGYVGALASEGSSLYVGGQFTSIGGQMRRNLAKVSTAGTGAADATWDPSPDAHVAALAIGAGHLYVGGGFTSIAGQPIAYLTRFGLAGPGPPDLQWKPEPTWIVRAAVYSAGNLHLGGWFSAMAGIPHLGYAVLTPNAVPGAPLITSIVAGDSQLAVTVGDSPVQTGFPRTYRVTCNPGTVTGTHTTRLVMARGLANGTSYSCSASVTDLNGSGLSSPPVSATPAAANVAGLGRSSNGVPFIADVRAFLATCPSSDPATAHILAATRLTYDWVDMPVEPCTAPIDVNAPPTAWLQLVQLLRVAYYMDPGASGLYPWTPGTYWDWLRTKIGTIDIRAISVSGSCCAPTLSGLPMMILAPPQTDVSLFRGALGRLIGLVSHELRHADGFPHGACTAGGTSCDPEYNVANLSAYGVAWYVSNLFITGQINVGLGCSPEGLDLLASQVGFQNGLHSQFNGAKPPTVSLPAQPGGPCRLQVDPASIPRLVNISTRGIVRTGDNVMIGGFIIGGSAPKTVVVRARGPSLTPVGVPGVLANPQVQLYFGQTLLAANDNWQQATNAPAITASGQAPTNANEAAILIQLNPGPYTAIVTGVGNGTGIGIVEVFEIDALGVPLINISTRGLVETGDNVLIGGFIIQGNGPQTVVVRARGPSLAQAGVPGVLANPQLQLYSGQTLIASNDNWQQATNANAITASGQAPTNANEAAILMTLDPGAYTAIVTGVGGTTGVAIVEVFKVN